MNSIKTEGPSLFTDYSGVEETKILNLAEISNANNRSFEEEVKEVYGIDELIKSSQSSSQLTP